MKNWLLLVAFGFFSTFLVAQDSPISWGIQVMPSHAYRKALPLNGTPIETLYALEEREKGQLAYSAGIRTEFNWGKKMGFQTGLNFIQLGFGTHRATVTTSIEGTATEIEQETCYDFANLEVPFILNFYQEMSSTGRVHFKMGGSAVYNLTKNLTTTQFDKGKQISEISVPVETGATANVTIQAGMGYEQMIGSRYALFLEPNFQYFLRSYVEDSQANRLPYMLGVVVGIKMK